jgi:hypothetical protein
MFTCREKSTSIWRKRRVPVSGEKEEYQYLEKKKSTSIWRKRRVPVSGEKNYQTFVIGLAIPL